MSTWIGCKSDDDKAKAASGRYSTCVRKGLSVVKGDRRRQMELLAEFPPQVVTRSGYIDGQVSVCSSEALLRISHACLSLRFRVYVQPPLIRSEAASARGFLWKPLPTRGILPSSCWCSHRFGCYVRRVPVSAYPDRQLARSARSPFSITLCLPFAHIIFGAIIHECVRFFFYRTFWTASPNTTNL